MPRAFVQKLALTLDMIKFPHSVFALPFALASALFAADGAPGIRQFLLIVACMVTARNAAMTFNRIVDRKIDALNPRTKTRPLAAGTLPLGFSVVFCAVNCVLFIASAALFNRLTLFLAPVAIVIVLGYSLTKRFTHYTQFFLGLALGSAPVAAWIALTGTVEPFPLYLGAGVLFWVAGFDLIYSCQDYEFDRAHGVKNLVAKHGIAAGLRIARLCHLLCALLFITAGLKAELGLWYFLGTAVIAGFLSYEHALVKPDDLSRVNAAFFTMNGVVSLSFFAFSLLEIYF